MAYHGLFLLGGGDLLCSDIGLEVVRSNATHILPADRASSKCLRPPQAPPDSVTVNWLLTCGGFTFSKGIILPFGEPILGVPYARKPPMYCMAERHRMTQVRRILVQWHMLQAHVRLQGNPLPGSCIAPSHLIFRLESERRKFQPEALQPPKLSEALSPEGPVKSVWCSTVPFEPFNTQAPGLRLPAPALSKHFSASRTTSGGRFSGLWDT